MYDEIKMGATGDSQLCKNHNKLIKYICIIVGLDRARAQDPLSNRTQFEWYRSEQQQPHQASANGIIDRRRNETKTLQTHAAAHCTKVCSETKTKVIAIFLCSPHWLAIYYYEIQ